MDRTFKIALICVMCLCLVVAVGGCKKKRPPINPSVTTTETQQTPSDQSISTGLPDVDQDKLLWSKATGLQVVYFDTSQWNLRPDAIETLTANAAKIKQAGTVKIQIEGHCDERGTQEFNVALGEKRAESVREYLMKVGIAGDRLLTISYGKERPAKEGNDEEAWKWNRRAEFNKAM